MRASQVEQETGSQAPFSPNLKQLLRSHAKRLSLAKSSGIFASASSAERFFCVEQGIIRLSVTGSTGQEAVLGVLEPGEWFGEGSLFSNAPYNYTIRAVTESELLAVPSAAFHAIVAQRPEFLLEFIRLLCGRYRWALQCIDATVLFSFPARLAQRLLATHRAHTFTSAVDVQALRLSQEDLGQMLGVARQSVNRQLKKWEKRNIIRLEYGRVVLLDMPALVRLAREGSLPCSDEHIEDAPASEASHDMEGWNC